MANGVMASLSMAAAASSKEHDVING